jgi:hypothetical protein
MNIYAFARRGACWTDLVVITEEACLRVKKVREVKGAI